MTQISTINRWISLFLTGSLAIILLTIFSWNPIIDFLARNRDLFSQSNFAIVPSGVAFLAVTALLGAAIDTLSVKSTNCLFWWSRRYKWIAMLFLNPGYCNSILRLEKRFYSLCQNSKTYCKTCDPKSDIDTCSADVFQNNAPEGIQSLLKLHYTIFSLCSNFATILFLTAIISLLLSLLQIGSFPFPGMNLWIIIFILIAYLQCVYAVYNLLYVYELTFRFDSSWLNDQINIDQHDEIPVSEKNAN